MLKKENKNHLYPEYDLPFIYVDIDKHRLSSVEISSTSIQSAKQIIDELGINKFSCMFSCKWF